MASAMETEWRTYSKVEVGMSVKVPDSGSTWGNRAQAEQSGRPWRTVAKVTKMNRYETMLVFTDGTSVERMTTNSRVLIRNG